MFLNFFISFLTLSFLAIKFCDKYRILIDDKSEKHKKFSSQKKNYLVGGFLIIVFFCYYFLTKAVNIPLLFFLTTIFIVGILSDIKKIDEVSVRFFSQLILIIFFVYFLNIEIKYTKIEFFDKLLENQIFNIFFQLFAY